ncbi:MAG TPA: RluA family pseudouridine synthase, partial [bacterium]|nr:RluA family pseudouridine synthase [bacterium]
MSDHRQVLDCRVELPADASPRLDVYLSEHLRLFSRSQARGRVVEVSVNGSAARLARKVRAGDILHVSYRDPPPLDLVPEDIPLTVLFENDDVIVVDKPAGMVVHPGSGNQSGTFLN